MLLFITKNITMQLPNELIIIIFNYIDKITDKRQFLRTCNRYNDLLKGLINHAEKKFMLKYKLDKNCYYYYIEKFTLELCHDSYFDMIPKSYFNENNRVLMELLVLYNKLELIKFALNNGCVIHFLLYTIAAQYGHMDMVKLFWGKNYTNEHMCNVAAYYGHLSILIWAMENGYENKLNKNIRVNARLNGHLNVVNWAIQNGCP